MRHVLLELLDWCLVGVPSLIAFSAVMDGGEEVGNVAAGVFVFCAMHFVFAVWYHLGRVLRHGDEEGGCSVQVKVFMEYVLAVSLCGVFDSDDLVYFAYCGVCALGMEVMWRQEEVVRWPLFFMAMGHVVYTACMVGELKDAWLFWFLAGFIVVLSGMDWVVSSLLRKKSVHAFFYAQLSLGVFVVLHVARVNQIGGAMVLDDDEEYLNLI